ncbi:helix-turn-helix domain-containing protein [Cysteiniphilum marinum]|uniref:helix-turn-helix domain-containing protein n=1 Tax=Cysteiniphilum marinum TaxID=2774191 RepID=UPI00193C4FD8|nr:helix-turn-helix domain-containing protein [Cysteiniphilum marinum]
MANQYSDTFKDICNKKYKKHVANVLSDFRKKGMTYEEVAQLCDVHVSTVRRWSSKYAIRLSFNRSTPFKRIHTEPQKTETFLDRFKEKHINSANFLSRKWSV